MQLFEFKDVKKKRGFWEILTSEYGDILTILTIITVIIGDIIVRTIQYFGEDIDFICDILLFDFFVAIVAFTVMVAIRYVIADIRIYIRYLIFIKKCQYLPFTTEEMSRLKISSLDEYIQTLFEMSKVNINKVGLFTYFSPFILKGNQNTKYLFKFPKIIMQDLWKFISSNFYIEDIYRLFVEYKSTPYWSIFLCDCDIEWYKNLYENKKETYDIEEFCRVFPQLHRKPARLS